MDEHLNYIAHWIGSIVSTGAVVGIIAGFLPPAAAIGALIWYYIQITESVSFRRWRAQRTARKLTHLRAQIAELEALHELEPEKPAG